MSNMLGICLDHIVLTYSRHIIMHIFLVVPTIFSTKLWGEQHWKQNMGMGPCPSHDGDWLWLRRFEPTSHTGAQRSCSYIDDVSNLPPTPVRTEVAVTFTTFRTYLQHRCTQKLQLHLRRFEPTYNTGAHRSCSYIDDVSNLPTTPMYTEVAVTLTTFRTYLQHRCAQKLQLHWRRFEPTYNTDAHRSCSYIDDVSNLPTTPMHTEVAVTLTTFRTYLQHRCTQKLQLHWRRF